MRAARWTRQAALGREGGSGDAALDAAVWEKTQKEVANYGLRGPFTEEELKRELGPPFVISRRFGSRQKDSVRVIDDLSESLVNVCVGTSGTID